MVIPIRQIKSYFEKVELIRTFIEKKQFARFSKYTLHKNLNDNGIKIAQSGVNQIINLFLRQRFIETVVKPFPGQCALYRQKGVIYKMDFQKDIKILLERYGIEEIEKHALIGNRYCKCGTCFCCACAEYLKDKENKLV